MSRPKYSTMLDVAFAIEHDFEDPLDIPLEDLIAALEQRIASIRRGNDGEAFGVCDTYEILPTRSKAMKLTDRTAWIVSDGRYTGQKMHWRRTSAVAECIDRLTVDLQYGASRLDVHRMVFDGTVYSPKNIRLFPPFLPVRSSNA